eukprot:5653517-Alexandrium_andersonii.AAC.1
MCPGGLRPRRRVAPEMLPLAKAKGRATHLPTMCGGFGDPRGRTGAGGGEGPPWGWAMLAAMTPAPLARGGRTRA